jgi:ATP-dependent Clp protease protease subunit
MEMSLTYAASPSKSMCFNHGVLHPQFPIVTINKNTTTGIGGRRRRKPVSTIKALKSSSSKQTLSTNWDVSQDSSVTSAPWLPRFEELDTTNMLLRQRIIFLGSQVDIFLLLCFFGLLVGFLRWVLLIDSCFVGGVGK